MSWCESACVHMRLLCSWISDVSVNLVYCPPDVFRSNNMSHRCAGVEGSVDGSSRSKDASPHRSKDASPNGKLEGNHKVDNEDYKNDLE